MSATWSRWWSALGEKRALIVGHDWGAPVAWHAALMRPDIFPAVVAMSVPHRRRGARRRSTRCARRESPTTTSSISRSRRAEDEFARDARYTLPRILYIGSGDTPREDKMSLYVDRRRAFSGRDRRSRCRRG